MYINDLSAHLHSAKSIFYADDTTLLFGGPCSNLQSRVEESVSSLLSWLSLNNLRLNSDKSVFMQFLTLNKIPESISLNKFEIEECSVVKFLGITVDKMLSWSNHVSQLCCKLNRICHALRTLQPLLDWEMLVAVYYGCFSQS